MSWATAGPACIKLLRRVQRFMQEFEKCLMRFVRPVEKATESRWSFQEGNGPPAYAVDGEAMLPQHDIARGRSAETFHAEYISAIGDVAMPVLRHTGLDREPSAE